MPEDGPPEDAIPEDDPQPPPVVVEINDDPQLLPPQIRTGNWTDEELACLFFTEVEVEIGVIGRVVFIKNST